MKVSVWIAAECELPAELVARMEGGESAAQAVAEQVAREAVELAFAKAQKVKVTVTAHAEGRGAK